MLWGGGGYFRTPFIVPVMCVMGGGVLPYPFYCASNMCYWGGGGLLLYPSYCASNVCWGGGGEYFRTPLSVPVMCVCVCEGGGTSVPLLLCQ